MKDDRVYLFHMRDAIDDIAARGSEAGLSRDARSEQRYPVEGHRRNAGSADP